MMQQNTRSHTFTSHARAVENSVALDTFSLIEITSTLIGFFIAIGLLVGLLWLGVAKKIPLKITRLVAGILLTRTAIPLSFFTGWEVSSAEFLHWWIPPLS